MKATLFTVFLFSALAFAQSTTPQTPPAGAKTQTGAGSATSHRGMHHGAMPGKGGMQGMAGHDMKAMVDHFTAMVDKLKADSANISDPAGKAVAQDNIDLWQAMLDHFKEMQEHMGMMQGMQGGMGQGKGSGKGQGTGQGTGRMPSEKKPPAQTPPPQQ